MRQMEEAVLLGSSGLRPLSKYIRKGKFPLWSWTRWFPPTPPQTHRMYSRFGSGCDKNVVRQNFPPERPQNAVIPRVEEVTKVGHIRGLGRTAAGR